MLDLRERGPLFKPQHGYCVLLGAQWLSGIVFDWRPRGRGFELHRHHCVVSLSKDINPSLALVQPRKKWECSGSVVECLTRDREAEGSSLTGVTTLWSLSKTHLS